MMRQQVYRIVVYEVDAALTPDGTAAPVVIEAARFATTAPTPWDAVDRWSEQVHAG